MQEKYKHYLGKSAQLFINKGKKYNLSGDLVEDNTCNTTNKMPLAGIRYLYIDYPLAASTSIALFDDAGRLILFFDSPSPTLLNNTLVAPPEGAAFIAFNLEKHDYIDSLVEADFIYIIKECSPVYSKLLKESEKGADQQYMTSKLNGKVSFFNDDYDFISPLLNKYIYVLENIATGKRDVAYFTKPDCEIDTLTKKATVNLQTKDIYSLIKAKWATRYNILEALPKTASIKSTKRPVVQLYLLGASTAISFVGNNFIETEVSEKKTILEDVHSFGFWTADILWEIEIKNCPIQEANGLYVGSGASSGLLYLSTNKSYFIQPSSPSAGTGKFYLAKMEDGAITHLYESTRSIYQANVDGKQYWQYGNTDFGMIEVGSAPTEVVFSESSPIYYHVTARVLADKSYSPDPELDLRPVPPSDFVNTGWNYKACIDYSERPSSASTFMSVYISGKSLEEPTPYGRNDFGTYFIYDLDRGPTSSKPIAPVGKDMWANSSIWVQPNNVYNANILEHSSTEYEIKDCIPISEALKAVIKKAGLPISHEATLEYSVFLYGRVWPGDIGTLQEDRFSVFISQITNLLKTNYSQAAKKAEVSLKELLDELAILFKCYWFIDSQNRLRIEHISYFLQGGTYDETARVIGADLTTSQDKFNLKKFAYGQQKISFDSSSFASSYKFMWPSIAFEQFNIEKLAFYDSYLTDSEAKEITSNIFSSDISAMTLQPEKFSNDGFAILCPIQVIGEGLKLPITTFKVKKQSNVENLEYLVTTLNGLASWNNLIYFHMWGMPGSRINPQGLIGRCSDNDTTIVDYPTEVKSVERIVKQENVVFIPTGDIATNSLIKTNIGEGSIEKLSTDIDTNLTTTTLKYEA